MKRSFGGLVITLAVMAGGATAVLGSPSINAIGLLTNYIPALGGGVANCTYSGLNAISPDGLIAVGYVHGDTYWEATVWEYDVDIAVYWSKTTGLVRRNDDWRGGPWTGIGGGTGTPGPTYPARLVGNLDGIGHYVGPPVGQDTPYHDNSPALEPVSNCLLADQNCVSGNGRYFAGHYYKRL